MSKLGFVLGRIKEINFGRMLDRAKQSAEKCGKPAFFILLDMAYCGFKYQAGYMDYSLFEMYNKNRLQRKSILTRGKNNHLVATLNNPDYTEAFDSKPEFHKQFGPYYTGREWLDLTEASPEQFAEFIRVHPDFVAKPPDGTHGDGVRRLSAGEANTGLYDELLESGSTLCEELVSQHPGMAILNPHAVNTVRIITVLTASGPEVVTALLRIGGVGSRVDNFNNGGMVTPVDTETGRALYPAVSKNGELFAAHPATGTKIQGFQIPMWQECLSLVREAAGVVPQVRYVGWDVAVAEKYPLLIEGNCYPGHDIYGLPPHSPDGMGVWPAFERAAKKTYIKR